MTTHGGKLENANVVAVFNSQDEAEETLLELRAAGVRDDRIGYFPRAMNGPTKDILGRSYRFTGAFIGAVLVGALAAGAGRILGEWSGTFDENPDPVGATVVGGILGVLFGGLAGGLIGEGLPRRASPGPSLGGTDGSFVMAVNAGETKDRVWDTVRRRGGREMPTGASAGHAHHPGGHPG